MNIDYYQYITLDPSTGNICMKIMSICVCASCGFKTGTLGFYIVTCVIFGLRNNAFVSANLLTLCDLGYFEA